jgi:hypothetical protein
MRARFLIAAVLLLSALAPVQPSGAEFVDQSSNPGNIISVAGDLTAPTATVSDPGSPLRGTIGLSGDATDSGSGLASVTLQHRRSGEATWTDVCTDTGSPYSCSLDTTALADGLYDFRALATDNDGNTATSTPVLDRRIDNTPPTATLADPGTYLRGTVSLSATADDGAGSGIALVTLERRHTGEPSWTDVCTDADLPYGCSFDTASLADGTYDLRALATDAAGNVGTPSLVAERTIDNTAPSTTDVQTANKTAGTAGKPEAGDTLTLSFSERVDPATVLAGWTGSATSVTARITDGGLTGNDVFSVWNSANTTQLTLGSVSLAATGYVSATRSFAASTMTLSSTAPWAVTVVLGTPSGATGSALAGGTMSWTPLSGITDLAGNPLATTTRGETGSSDKEF